MLPFKRTASSPLLQELDEVATAERAADDGLWLPQTRPAPARWLSLAVVIDAAPSMDVWRPTTAAFVDLLAHHGSFSRCREFRLVSPPDGSWARVASGTGSAGRHPAELLDPTGRQIIIVLTDGRGAVWRGDEVARLMRLWGSAGPLAIVSPEPQQYWHRTGLRPRRARVRAPRALAPNAQFDVQHPTQWRDPFEAEDAEPSGFPVPVLELSSRWLRWWARLVTAPTGGWVDASLFVAGARHSPDDAEPSTEQPPAGPSSTSRARELVLRFRASATPLAYRLATRLAAAPLNLRLARRIQAATLPESMPHHLAEVMNSELVYQTPDTWVGADRDFTTGVRDVLLSASTRDDTARVLDVVAIHYGDQFPDPQALELADGTSLSADALPLARIELVALRALSGPYTVQANLLARSISAVEDSTGIGDGGPATGADTESEPQNEDPAPETTETTSTEAATAQEGVEMTGPLDDDLGTNAWPVLRPKTPSDSYPLPGRSSAAAADDTLTVDALFGTQEQDIGPAIWGNVPPRNPSFTGRTELLTQLERRLRAQSVTAVLPQALHGMGGVGKTQIAIEYAYRQRNKYELIWWVPSEHPGQILASLAELGEQFGHEAGLEANTAVARVRTALSSGAPYSSWLLIFDNAETVDAVRPYFPESGTGKILVTSRNPEWGQVAHTLEVDVFTREESIALLKRHNPEADDGTANRLAQALGDLPLAVEQASAWCTTTDTQLPDYLDLLNEKLDELASLVHEPGYELPVAAAWGVALDRLREENLPALRLLQVCSFFAPEPISRELFTSPRVYPTVPELDEALQNPSRLSALVREIQKYGLARIDHRSNTIQLHRLVKAVLIGRMSERRRATMEHGAHVLLTGGNPGGPDKRALWPRYLELASHVTASRMITCEDIWARELVLDVIKFYYYWGDLTTSRDLAQQAVDEWRVLLGRDHLQTLRASKWLGFVHRSLGNFAAAREINADCLERSRRILGPDDEDTIDAMSLVAADLRIAGDFMQAREMDLEAFNRARQTLGEDDPMTLRAAHSLGVSLRMTGEFSAARQLDSDTHRRRAAVLGDDHLETMRTINGLTLDHRECGKYLEAHELQEHLYSRYQALFRSATHPMMITAARNLAVARRRAGLHEAARKLSEEVWHRYQQRFGPDYPETLAAALNYAVDLREAGELTKSAALGEQTVEQYRNILGSDHPYTMYARTNLAIVLRLHGSPDEARLLNEQALRHLSRRLGPDHILTLTCAINLASDLARLSEYRTAYDLDQDTHIRCSSVLGTDHPTTLATGLNLSLDLAALGRTPESELLYATVIDRYCRVLGDEHTAVRGALTRKRANCDVDPMPF